MYYYTHIYHGVYVQYGKKKKIASLFYLPFAIKFLPSTPKSIYPVIIQLKNKINKIHD